MKSLLNLLLSGMVLCSAVAAQDKAEFRFYRRGEARHFELRLAERYHSSGRTVVLARLGERSPEIYLAYPGQIKPYNESSYFAGMYRGEGEYRIEVVVTCYGEERVTEEQVVFPAAGPEMPEEAWNRYVAAQAAECEQVLKRDPHAAFFQYVRLLASQRADVPLREVGRPGPRWLRIARRPVDLYSIATGALAIQETLQLAEMTGAYRAEQEKKVALGELGKVKVRSHPFKKMLEGKRPVISDITHAVPLDFYYCRFQSLDDLLSLFEFLEQWGNHFLRTYAVAARDDHLAEKYIRQMLLDTDPVSRELFRQLIGEMAIIGSDPFFLSGADVTLVIRTGQGDLLEAYMEQKVQKAMKLRPDLTPEKLKCLDVELRVVRTPDRAVSCVFGHADGFWFVGNSLSAVKRAVSALRGQISSLDEALDFRYMRTIYPADAAEEDGFIYLSEAFLRNVIGPRLKIKGQRRIRCVNELRIIEHAALLFELERGRRPESMAELASNAYLPEHALRCPDGGRYSFDPKGRVAACSVHNRLPYLTPQIETSVGLVTKREKQDYERFVQQYNSYWRTYFDPVAIRIGVGQQMSFETQILPLIENSIYEQFRQVMGGEGVNLRGPILLPTTIMACGGRVNPSAVLSGTAVAEALDRRLGGNTVNAILSAFEGAAFLMICDGEPLYRFDFSDFAGEVLRWRMQSELVYLPVLAGLQLPTYLALKIKERAAFDQFLSGVHRYAAERSAEQQFGRFAVHLDFAELPPYRECRVYEIGAKAFAFEVRYYYTAVGGYLYLANRLRLIHSLIDTHKEGGASKEPALTGNLMIRFLPRNWKQIRRDIALGWEAKSRQACLTNFSSIEPLLHVTKPAQPLREVWEGSSRRTYFCPDGGSYSLREGRAFCSVHGHPDFPAQPETPHATSRIAALLEQCEDITVVFSFTEDGVATQVKVALGR